jgi:hypothetical protein
MAQRALIEVPIPQLVEICDNVTPFKGLCYNRDFWLARARARYGVSPKQFKQAEKISGTQFRFPPLLAYILLLLDYFADTRAGVAEERYYEAAREIHDFEDIVMAHLRRQAQRKANGKVDYYAITDQEIDQGFLFPAASPEEALLSITEWMGERYNRLIEKEITGILRNRLNFDRTSIPLNRDIDFTQSFIELIRDIPKIVVSDFQQGEVIEVESYDKIRPRVVSPTSTQTEDENENEDEDEDENEDEDEDENENENEY